MLENSQMRENMLLQYADDIIKVEMGSLRGEMLRLVGQRNKWSEFQKEGMCFYSSWINEAKT